MVGKPVCAVLLVLGTIALVAGGLASYAQRAVLDRQAFADRATAALEQDEVRDEVAARLTTREIEAVPALAPRRPVIEAAIDDVLGDGRFPAVWHAGAEKMHNGLFDGADVQLSLPGAGSEIRAAVGARS